MNASLNGGPPKPFALSSAALDFAPGLLAIQESPPARLPRAVLYTVTVLVGLLLLWVTFGRLDIVASADGRLVPKSYLKVIQPADGGIVKAILVQEGERVTAGQVLLRMDAQDAHADALRLRSQLALRSLELRRIDAELQATPLQHRNEDPPDLFHQVDVQYRGRRQAYLDALAQAQAQRQKAQRDAVAGKAVLTKLRETNPILKSQAQAYASLGDDGYVPKVTVSDKQRAYLENAQDLAAQAATVQGLSATVDEAGQQVREITSKYRSDLENERLDAEGEYRKLQQDWVKQAHRATLLELKTPQSGIVKDIATHTIGTVVSAGTVLLSVVPEQVPLVAEVMIKNDDVGFVHTGQRVKVKLAAYPFQKYGMLDGKVLQVWPDASDANPPSGNGSSRTNTSVAAPSAATGYKALVALDRQTLRAGGESLHLVAGMQVIAEIREGHRTVLDYLLSPLRGALHDSGQER